MKIEQAKKLFDKYVKNECTEAEIKLLEIYLDSFQDKDELWSQLNYDEEIKDKVWTKINTTLSNERAKVQVLSLKKYYKYAAVFIGLIGGILWYQFSSNEIKINQVSVADDAIILKTSDNKRTEINTNGKQVVVDKNGKIVGQQNGGQISYESNEELEELVYNEIIVPDGKKFKLILSDGSLAHMNSGSSLKYPVNFISGENRKVLLKGEAYFEVTKDTKHPFLVATEEMEIKVLGTNFNVSSYQGSDTFTVLAEGSVAVYDKKSSDSNFKTIRPGEKAIIADNTIEVIEVDVNDYLGWREGLLAFNNEQFINIIRKIERQYGVNIKNEFTALESVRFRGFFKDETIIDLLDTFKESAGFEYTITNQKIIIKAMKE